MSLTLHGFQLSPPVRATMLTLKALGLEFNQIPIRPAANEHLTPEYLKLNPLHTIPTLEDGDFVIYDSHAVMAYLADKYADGGALYPKDLKKRAVINQRMYFDCGTLFPRFFEVVRSLVVGGEKTVSKGSIDKITEGYDLLETLLEKSTHVAGDELSLADFSVVATVTSMNIVVPLATDKYPKITKWIETMQKLPYYTEGNQKGIDKATAALKGLMS